MMFARNVLMHSEFSYSKKWKGDNYETRKTCKCIAALSRVNDNNPDKTCEFIAKREYQVDVYYYLDRSHYKVYLNGG